MLHLIGLTGEDASLPGVGSVRILAVDGAALVVQDIPPDFGAETAQTLTEALLAEAWGALCRLSETRDVLAFRFGQTVEDEDAARRVAREIGAAGMLAHGDVKGGEEWSLSFSARPGAEVAAGSYLAARAAERRARLDLAETAQAMLRDLDGPRRVSAAVTEEGAVGFQVLLPRGDRDDILERIGTSAEKAGLAARATGPQPVLHFAPDPDDGE